MEDNYSEFKELVGFYDDKPTEKTPEQVEPERKEYEEFLFAALKRRGEKGEFWDLWLINNLLKGKLDWLKIDSLINPVPFLYIDIYI